MDIDIYIDYFVNEYSCCEISIHNSKLLQTKNVYRYEGE